MSFFIQYSNSVVIVYVCLCILLQFIGDYEWFSIHYLPDVCRIGGLEKRTE